MDNFLDGFIAIDHHTSLHLEKRFHNMPKNNERSDNKF
jgi:hypothetical protein